MVRRRTPARRQVNAVVVLSRVRSGTTVFRRFLASHPQIHDCGEVLNPNVPLGLFPWLAARARWHPSLVRPDQQLQAVPRYLEWLATKTPAGTTHAVLDVKLESSSTLAAPFQEIGSAAGAIAFAHNAATVLFLRRRDQLARFVSNQRAVASGRYHIKSGVPAQDLGSHGDLLLDYSDEDLLNLRRRLANWISEEDRLLETLRMTQAVHELWYEDLFADTGAFDEQLSQQVASLLGVAPVFDQRPTLERLSNDNIWSAFADPHKARSILRPDCSVASDEVAPGAAG